MVRIASTPALKSAPAWHEVFLRMLPAILAHARFAFRHLRPDAREEAVQGVVCNACAATARLAELGKLDLAYPTILARYGVAQVNDGRMTGGRLNCKDPMSPYCQRLKGVVVEQLDQFDEENNTWAEAVVQDTRTAPVPEIVAFRCDFAEWLRTLPRRKRRIAETLALGHGTGDVAKRFKVCQGRISQLRRELEVAWGEFTGEAEPPETAVPA